MPRMVTIIPQENNFLYSEFKTQTKQQAEANISKYGMFSVGGKPGQFYRGLVKNGYIFLYTAQKFRRKTQLVPLTKKNKVKNGANESKFKTEVLRPNHWQIRVYKFPLERVIEATQLNRTFKVVLQG